MKNEKGITLVILVVTVIILLTLTGMGVSSGIEAYKTMKVQNFVAQMKAIQQKVNVVADEYKSWDEYNGNNFPLYLADRFSENASSHSEFSSIISSLSSNSDITSWSSDSDNTLSNYYYFNPELLESELGLKGIENRYVIINFNTGNVIDRDGVENPHTGEIIYRQYDIDMGEELIDSLDSNTFVSAQIIEDNYLSKKIKVTAISGNGDAPAINKVYYAKYGVYNWADASNLADYTVEGNSATFSLHEGGNMVFKVADYSRNTYTSDPIGVYIYITDVWTSGSDSVALEKTTTLSDGGKTFTVPAGYKIASDSGRIIDKGVVIKDSSGNEWVWVPVPDATVMYEEVSTPVALCGSTGVTTNRYSKTVYVSGLNFSKPPYSNNLRVQPGITEDIYGGRGREPEMIGANVTNYSNAGYSSASAMAQGFVNEYSKMIDSVAKYGGFYVGRYELSGSISAPTIKKNQVSLKNQSWENQYKACKIFSSDYATSGMIWGCQWDVMCSWLQDSGINIKDSSGWGNYKDTAVMNSAGTSVIKASGTQAILNTGVTDFTRANNIYDLAGNLYDWTMEGFDITSYYDGCRLGRGGHYEYSNENVFENSTIAAGAYNSAARPMLLINP